VVVGDRLAAGRLDLLHHLVGGAGALSLSADAAAEIVHHHLGAARGEQERVRAAEAISRAGHERNTTIETDLFTHGWNSMIGSARLYKNDETNFDFLTYVTEIVTFARDRAGATFVSPAAPLDLRRCYKRVARQRRISMMKRIALIGCLALLGGQVACKKETKKTEKTPETDPTAGKTTEPTTETPPPQPEKAKLDTPEDKVAFVKACNGYLNGKDWDKFGSCMTDSATFEHVDSMMPPSNGKQAIVDNLKNMATAFPDFAITPTM